MKAKRKAQKPTAAPKLRAVIVTTEHRGVFFGYAEEIDGDPIVLKDARMCVYWSPDMHGIMGLATMGPSATCRVSPAVDEFQARDVTSVIAVSPEAVKRWEASPWG